VVAPIVSAVTAPAKFKVVVVVLYKSCVELAPTTVGLLMVSVPVAAPRLRVDAAPPTFNVVAVVFNKLNVVSSVIISPPPTNKSLAIATPPATRNAPVVSLVVSVSSKTLVILLRSQLVVA
jgi:hypothetical protein